jgi:hypothetical protein
VLNPPMRLDPGCCRARPQLLAKPVSLLGTGESVETPMVSQMADFTSSRDTAIIERT